MWDFNLWDTMMQFLGIMSDLALFVGNYVMPALDTILNVILDIIRGILNLIS